VLADLVAAAFFGHAPCVAVLLYYGARVDVVSAQGTTALDEAKGETLEMILVFSKKVSRRGSELEIHFYCFSY
jgi:hypothetical protein